MFDPTTVPMAQIAHDAAQIALQAGPPADLPAQVPDFVSDILARIGESAGDASGGLGESISGMTPSGEEAEAGAQAAANETSRPAAAANAPGR